MACSLLLELFLAKDDTSIVLHTSDTVPHGHRLCEGHLLVTRRHQLGVTKVLAAILIEHTASLNRILEAQIQRGGVCAA